MNARTKHSPGPWHIVPQADVSAWRIADADSVFVADVYMHGPTTGGPRDASDAHANLTAMLAAPELLAALNLAPHKLADEACGRAWACGCPFCRAARTAIARATITKEVQS